jgi:uncharacterized protein (DUF302 family)
MTYYIEKTLDAGLDEAVERVTAALKEEGFGVLTDIDVRATLKNKLGVDFRPYRILGACNPGYAHKALQLEPMIGTMLPCNVIVQETDGGTLVAAIDPIASMQAVTNPDLGGIAGEVRARLADAIARLA